eukprot:CAMPEP_0184860668 /NCGR_PEP_ID=MMETSP0580-20130426/5521_1 /TAXON_ID=1118495 /ORGANISM="Dactyliosolen fragilissimus" /LENGTH=515 /DNA_ID=CAMNT_0027357875 /DNA_START=246 /DNA_END=1793 /DNA_ORIENTATION=-
MISRAQHKNWDVEENNISNITTNHGESSHEIHPRGRKFEVLIDGNSSSDANESFASQPSKVISLLTLIDGKWGLSSDTFKLWYGVCGIYVSFMFYGSFQEDVFAYTSAKDNQKFTSVWLLQVIEGLSNILVGYIGIKMAAKTYLASESHAEMDDTTNNGAKIDGKNYLETATSNNITETNLTPIPTTASKNNDSISTTTSTTYYTDTINKYKTLRKMTKTSENTFSTKTQSSMDNKLYYIPQNLVALTGMAQVFSKAFTSLSLASGLSYPVATLAKSAKMAPVMMGQLFIGGSRFQKREYLQVGAIIAGTACLSMSRNQLTKMHANNNSINDNHLTSIANKFNDASSPIGFFFIIFSLVMDGITGGIQKKLKNKMQSIGHPIKPYDFMFYTSLYMMITASCISLMTGDMFQGIQFCKENPRVLSLILNFCFCSAIGQSFIYHTLAHFDPLVCSTVTTTRKVFSVLVSILWKESVNSLDLKGYIGILLACGGILSEVKSKITNRHKMKKSISKVIN